MGTEDTPIRMEFIDHNKLQVLEEGHPLRMVREDPRMKHIRIGNDDITLAVPAVREEEMEDDKDHLDEADPGADA
jgi:hypothetical protein